METGRAVTSLIYPDKDYLSGKWVQKESLSQIYVLLICLVYLSVILKLPGRQFLQRRPSVTVKKKRRNSILGQLGMSGKQIARLDNRQLMLLFLLPLPPALITSGRLMIYDGARKLLLDTWGMPVFTGNMWIWQAVAMAVGFLRHCTGFIMGL